MDVDLIKQTIVIRKGLQMRKGKMIAQGCHASMMFIANKMKSKKPLSDEEQHWLDNLFTKVCLYVNTEDELFDVYEKAKADGLTVHIVRDSGKTEFRGEPTYTCLAIGPHASSKIDKITSNLKLL